MAEMQSLTSEGNARVRFITPDVRLFGPHDAKWK